MTRASTPRVVAPGPACSRPRRSKATSTGRRDGSAAGEHDEQLPLFDVSDSTASTPTPTGCKARPRAAQAARPPSTPVTDAHPWQPVTGRITSPDPGEIPALIAAAEGEGNALTELLDSIEQLLAARQARLTLASLGADAVQRALRHRHLVLVPQKTQSDA